MSGDCIGDTGAIAIAGGSGLKPPGTSSLDPIGIPDRPTAAPAPNPPGEEADAAGFDAIDPPAVAHVPDIVPLLPPPSNGATGLDMPGVPDSPAPAQPAPLPPS